MSRCGCPEEDSQQSAVSPGLVLSEEPIIFVLPFTDDQVGIQIFKNGRLKEKQLSICRAAHCNYSEMYDQVVQPQLAANSAGKYRGYYWALCSEIRDILAVLQQANKKKKTKIPENVGAFCVIDDGEADYRAHSRMGYANPSPEFWDHNDRNAARGNLLLTFQKRGIQIGGDDPPFKKSNENTFVKKWFSWLTTSIGYLFARLYQLTKHPA